jgi:hypothetical protein
MHGKVELAARRLERGDDAAAAQQQLDLGVRRRSVTTTSMALGDRSPPTA